MSVATEYKPLFPQSEALSGEVGVDVGNETNPAHLLGTPLWLTITNDLQHAGGKRRFDILMSLLLLLLTGPLMLFVISILWLSSLGRAPVFYRQQRVGLNGSIITLLKFRSMRVDAERDGVRMAALNDPRVTLIGRWIRRTRIDELPQLLNVLRGEMSLVGPRPERPEFVAQYADELDGYSLRHLVKPGITGWAQVKYGYGENLRDAAVKLYYDIDYIRNSSLLRDVVILLLTVPVVLMGKGAR